MKHSTLWILPVVLFGVVLSAQAQMRCGQQRIQLNDPAARVLKYCGQPDLKEGERWLYNFGAQQKTWIVTVFGGSVQQIETGPYGISEAEAAARKKD